AATHVEGFFANTVAAAKQFGIAHELLDAAAIRTRFPQFNIRDNEIGYFERDAGFLRPEKCIRAQLDLARKHGAEIRPHETLLGFEADARGVTVKTDRGTYSAKKLVLAAGPWLPELLGESVRLPLKVLRQVQFWFAIDGSAADYAPDRMPVFIWEVQGGAQGIYGFPAVDGPRGGVKVATEQYLSTTTASTVARDVTPDEIAAMYRDHVAPNLPGLGSRCIKAAACLYTVTPDAGFVIDAHPASERITIVSACSGHGFKHSAAIGEAIAQQTLEGASTIDLSAFSLSRFA
ncbi:MAG TPA: N-methyl-L-tryptophan oxidase, partial [Rhizomicrobium sp.]|nr:N-methyl-L-tryptophan oxidase [Rhizomicrobium sp.]